MLIKLLRTIGLSYLLFICVNLSANTLSNINHKATIENENARNAAIVLNYIHSSLNKVIMYNDKIVLESEYDNIINNINLTVIEDKEVVQIITKLMDTISVFKLNDMEKEKFLTEYENKISEALTATIIKNSSKIQGTDPVTLAMSVAINSKNAYKQYNKAANNAKRTLAQGQWQLEKNAITELNDIRKEFLLVYWKIMKKYNMPDKWRITEKQYTRFFTILKGTDEKKKLRQLLRMQEELSVLPTFWYEISLVMHKLGKGTEELSAIKQYEILNSHLLRHNAQYSLMLSNKVLYLNLKTQENEILNILKKIYKVDPLNPERKLFLAMQYSLINHTEKATNLLNQNIDDNFLPIISKKLKAHIFIKEKNIDKYKMIISDLLNKQMLSASEYLIYYGELPVNVLAENILNEVNKIKISINKSMYGKDTLLIELPKKWVLRDISNSEVNILLENREYKFTAIDIIDQSIKYTYNDIIEYDYLINKTISEINLKIIYKDIPINIKYDVVIIKPDVDLKKQDNNETNSSVSLAQKSNNIIDNTFTDLYNKSEVVYSNYKAEPKFIPKSITVNQQCFDIKNSLNRCKDDK